MNASVAVFQRVDIDNVVVIMEMFGVPDTTFFCL
jgi:hypothetical protein